MNDKDFNITVDALHSLYDVALNAAYDPGPTIKPGGDFSREWLVKTHIPMGLNFMIDMLPTVIRRIRTISGNLNLIDVGCGMGGGTELLGNLLNSLAWHGKREIHVDACDALPVYTRFHKAFNRSIHYFNAPLENLVDKSYSIALCSHMLEHYEDPYPLIKKLRMVAKNCAIIMVPFDEPLGTYGGHHFRFSEKVIKDLKPIEYCTKTPISNSACFVLPAA